MLIAGLVYLKKEKKKKTTGFLIERTMMLFNGWTNPRSLSLDLSLRLARLESHRRFLSRENALSEKLNS